MSDREPDADPGSLAELEALGESAALCDLRLGGAARWQLVPLDRTRPERVLPRPQRRLREHLERLAAASASDHQPQTCGAASDPATDEERITHDRHRPNRNPRA